MDFIEFVILTGLVCTSTSTSNNAFSIEWPFFRGTSYVSVAWVVRGLGMFSRFLDITSFQTQSEPNSIRNKFIVNLDFTCFFCLVSLLRSSIRACMTYIVFWKSNQNDLFCFELNLPHSSFPPFFVLRFQGYITRYGLILNILFG
jgi:hypothetical protein